MAMGVICLLMLASPGLAQSAAEYFVSSLPDVAADAYFPTMHAGTLPVSDDSSLFFWHIASQFQVTEPKTVLWLNGGPGCSSMDGALLELGPFRFSEDGSELVENVNGWNKYANLLFLDQPFGTGYSEVNEKNYVHDLEHVAENVLLFLQKWYEVFPEHKTHELYLAGESYAGQYIPYIYQAIAANDSSIPVAGVYLNNPWIDPAHQYLSYVPFIRKKGLITKEKDLETLEHLHTECAQSLSESEAIHVDNDVCNRISQYALKVYEGAKSCFNIYNIELTDTYPSCGMNWPPGIEFMSSYLSRSDVRRAFNVKTDGRWTECSSSVSRGFGSNNSPPAVYLLPEIIEDVPVLLMVGDLDYICNRDGLDAMVDNLQWGGSVGISDGKLEPFMMNNEVIGSIQASRNLTVVHLNKGSHMTPFELPYETRAVLHGFAGIATAYNASMEFDMPHSSREKDKIISDAMYRAYYQAGFVALAVVGGVMLIVGAVWWKNGGHTHVTLKGLMNALLHAAPKKGRPLGEYVNLQSFRRGRPETIYEEEEEEV